MIRRELGEQLKLWQATIDQSPTAGAVALALFLVEVVIIFWLLSGS